MKPIYTLLFILFFSINSIAQFGYPICITPHDDDFESPTNSTLSDLDNDGDLDLIISGYIFPFQNKLHWMENLDGKGNYGLPKFLLDSGYGNHVFQPFDIDADGDQDIIVGFQNEIIVFENSLTSTADFSTSYQLASLDNNVINIELVDINNDTRTDIICQVSGNKIGWLRAFGTPGNFFSYNDLTTMGSWDFSIDDMDNDGDLDIVTANYDNTIRELVWFKNLNGFGSFGDPIIIDADVNSLKNIMTIDLGNDNEMDIITTDASIFQVDSFANYFYINEVGSDNFGTKNLISKNTDISSPFNLDYDGDDDQDFFITENDEIFHFEFNPISQEVEKKEKFISMNGELMDLEQVDIDGNDSLDLFLIPEGPSAFLFLKNDNGLYEDPIDFTRQIEPTRYHHNETDIDGDGIPELITSSAIGVAWRAYDNSVLKFEASHLIPVGNSIQGDPRFIDYGDLDGDGDNDMIAYFYKDTINNTVVWFENIDNETNFQIRDTLFIGNYEYGNLKIADIDGDNDNDAYFIKTSGTESGIYWCENIDGLGSFSTANKINVNEDTPNTSILVDVDADGDQDVLFANYLPKKMGWFENVNGIFSSAQYFSNPNNLSVQFSFVDLDNDGLKDIVYRASSVYWRKNLGGAGNFGPEVLFQETSQGGIQEFAFADIDNDFDNDFFILTKNEVSLLFFENLGGQNGFATVKPILNIPEGTTRIYFVNYDGDKDLDLLATSYWDGKTSYLENFIDKPTISGKVFFDSNENGIFDLTELPVNLQTINIEPDGLASLSSDSGEFEFFVDNGVYEVSCEPFDNFTLTTPQLVEVEVTDTTNATINFGIKTLIAEVDANIHLTSAPTRCGFTVPFWLEVQNSGSVLSDVELILELDALVSFDSASVTPDSIVGNFIYWNFENVVPSYSRNIQLFLQMPTVDFQGELLNFNVVANLTDSSNNLSASFTTQYQSEVTCAYDPNDKLVKPDLLGDNNYLIFGDTLEYTIRFQNTGNDTAFTVRIEDYLDPNLDWNSFQLIGSSHPVEALYDQNTRKLKFTFSDILLPDSLSNELASHGYVSYKIEHAENLSEYTYISNQASIFFDFNPPIITNTVENILIENYPLELYIQHPKCNGDSTGFIQVINNEPFFQNYTWSDNSIGSTNLNLPAGEYQLTIELSSGEQIDTTISLIDPSPITITESQLTPVSCFGFQDGEISLDVDGGLPNYNYDWSNGTTESSIQGIGEGTYFVTITDFNNCVLIDSFEINAPSEISLTYTSTPELDNSSDGSAIVTVTGGIPPYSYLWDFDNSINENMISQMSSGTYQVTITDSHDCQTFTTVIIDQITDTDELFNKYNFSISPNPSDGKINILIELKNNESGKILIQNSLGQTIQKIDLNKNIGLQKNFEVDLPIGVFTVSLVLENKFALTKKLIIIKP